MTTFTELPFKAADGYRLSGRFFAPPSDVTAKTPILIGSATGIVQRFYQAFAEWLSAQGYPVMTFDFRGIGQSLHGPVSRSEASITLWGTQDLPAAIEALCTQTGQDRIMLMGHSAGGQLLGIAPNFARVKKVVAVAGSTGFVKNLKGRTKFLAPVMFNVVFPVSSLLLGYGATKRVGMGENLPRQVAAQWREFCSTQGYVTNTIGKTVHNDYHAGITCPIVSITASDDEIATPANAQAFLDTYPHAQTQFVGINPGDYQHQTIGHMGWFKKSHQNLWPVLLKLLEN